MQAFAYMAGTLEEVARRFEEQARVKQPQHMLQSQQESINDLMNMMTFAWEVEKEDEKFKN